MYVCRSMLNRCYCLIYYIGERGLLSHRDSHMQSGRRQSESHVQLILSIAKITLSCTHPASSCPCRSVPLRTSTLFATGKVLSTQLHPSKVHVPSPKRLLKGCVPPRQSRDCPHRASQPAQPPPPSIGRCQEEVRLKQKAESEQTVDAATVSYAPGIDAAWDPLSSAVLS